MKFIYYGRVSTREQGQSGLGLDAQLRTCRESVERQGGTIIADYVDVQSGKSIDRPELAKALRHRQAELPLSSIKTENRYF